jgi:transcriptional regulator with XRE-family HTH domain
MKTLGEFIREQREKNDLSLREFARKLDGLSAAFLSDIELGRRYPSEEVLKKMALALDLDLEELKSYDTRVPFKELRQMVESNPKYGLAFRKVIESKLTPEELIQKLDEEKRD